jgi:nucleoside-diphosphate-sugar epimerase
LRDAVLRARPDVVIHQLTDLPQTFDPSAWHDSLARNARLRIDGTANLVAAARAAGARRLIAQSIAFAYAAGRSRIAKAIRSRPPRVTAPGAVTARGVRALENAVAQCARH